MKLTELLPEIPEAEQTPLVKQWVAIIELLVECNTVHFAKTSCLVTDFLTRTKNLPL